MKTLIHQRKRGRKPKPVKKHKAWAEKGKSCVVTVTIPYDLALIVEDMHKRTGDSYSSICRNMMIRGAMGLGRQTTTETILAELRAAHRLVVAKLDGPVEEPQPLGSSSIFERLR